MVLLCSYGSVSCFEESDNYSDLIVPTSVQSSEDSFENHHRLIPILIRLTVNLQVGIISKVSLQ